MKIIDKGHVYQLNYAGDKNTSELIHFIKKVPGVGEKLEVIQDGTTNEEVLAVLIDRIKFLQTKLTSRENTHAITLLEKALMWLNKRTDDRKKRKVEGTHKE